MTLAIQGPITRDPGPMTLAIQWPHPPGENAGRWPHVPGDRHRISRKTVVLDQESAEAGVGNRDRNDRA